MAHQTCLIGYPPSDYDVLAFLTSKPSRGNDNIASIMRCFLIALFKTAATTLKDMGSISKSDQIRNFRTIMSKEQTMKSAGLQRLMFHESVVKEAQNVRRKYLIRSILSNSLVLT